MANFRGGNRSGGGRGFSAKGGPASGWESGRDERNGDRQMFDATCDECKNRCQVPFQPSGDKPVYCSNCFGDKKGAGNKEKEQFEQLNNKLDEILMLLTSKAPVQAAKKKPSKKKTEALL